MIIALRDRFGDQGGYQNFFESGNTPGERYNTLSSGELLRAGRTGSAWTLENAATVSSAGVTTVTAGVADNDPALTGSFAALAGTPWGGSYGPGGAYYYYNHNFTGTNVPAPFGSDISTSHYLKSMGGIAFLPGHNEIVTTAIDPVSAFYTSGIIKNYNLGSNAGNMSGTLALITPGSGGATNMGKAAALGELEVLLDAQTIEIGNRVWNDLNANGRQDADEPGINNVTVVLRSPGSDGLYNTGDDQTWSVVTDGGGNYYFDNSFVNDTRRPVSWIGVSATNSGILPGFEYKVEIDGTQASLTGLLLTAAHISTDETDSDGSYNVVNAEYIINPGGSTAPGSSFENNYNIDFGFASSGLLASSKLSLVAGLISTDVNLVWKTADELDIKKYDIERSTDGQYFSAIGSAVSKGNGSFVYTVKDNIENLAVYGIYYRVKVTALSGKVYYSETVMVNRKPVSQVTVSPNPFTSFIRVQLSSQNNGEAFIRVMNAGGQLVSSKTIQLVQGQNAFNISGLGNLSKGLYFLEIRRGNNITREKIMK